ncbi:MAG: hypothetical protein D4R67_04410 [Bacteroidetes bacterium]|nr:MAG: hypothetical protein D4R67_04410 [Bacteroidota bacterium]
MGSKFPWLRDRIKTWNIPLIIQVWIFSLVILFFQLIWEEFEVGIDSFPPFEYISDTIGNILLSITPGMINPFFPENIVRDGISIILPNGLYVNYFFYLSGVKQMCLVIILFILVPGPWKKKLWYIPLALAILLFSVFFRFLLMTIHTMIQPEYVHLLNDLLLGPLFYFEILFLWMAWVLIVAKTARLKRIPAENEEG